MIRRRGRRGRGCALGRRRGVEGGWGCGEEVAEVEEGGGWSEVNDDDAVVHLVVEPSRSLLFQQKRTTT